MERDLMLERIVKAIIHYNRQPMTWYPKYLELQDNFELVIEEKDGGIILSTKRK